jgi:hypothetical protein
MLQNSLSVRTMERDKVQARLKGRPFLWHALLQPSEDDEPWAKHLLLLLVSAARLAGGCCAESRRGCPERSSCGRRQTGGARARRMCCYKVQTDAESLCGSLRFEMCIVGGQRVQRESGFKVA